MVSYKIFHLTNVMWALDYQVKNVPNVKFCHFLSQAKTQLCPVYPVNMASKECNMESCICYLKMLCMHVIYKVGEAMGSCWYGFSFKRSSELYSSSYVVKRTGCVSSVWGEPGNEAGLTLFPGLPRLQLLIACSIFFFLHTANAQKLEAGKAWERGQERVEAGG